MPVTHRRGGAVAAGDGVHPADRTSLTEEDVARGWPCGWVGDPPPTPSVRPVAARGASTPPTPRQAVEAVLADALEKPPCLVAFSGGRDSSLVLAAAVQVARRRRLPPPVAVTERFDGVAEADESRWQEQVVRHLGVADWERLPAADHVDLLGPAAAASLRRHGLLWPAMVHTRAWYLPSLLGAVPGTAGRDLARPLGSVVDGEGGDEVLGGRRLAPLLVLAGYRCDGHGRRDRHTAVAALRSMAPRPLRRAVERRSVARDAPAPWLRPAAGRAFARALADDAAVEPLGWAAAVRRHLRRRSVVLGIAALDRVIAGAGALPVHPLLHPLVVEAVAAAGGGLGYGTRTATLARCFGGLLPDDVLRRTGKATFTGVGFGPAARAFAAAWDGRGLPAALVDAELLVETWQLPEPSALSFTALHAAWLAGRGGRTGP